MIYTNVPIEQVLSPPIATEKETPAEEKINAFYLGEQIVVSKTDNGQYLLDRLISTNPQSFLRQRLSPGTVINAERLSFY